MADDKEDLNREWNALARLSGAVREALKQLAIDRKANEDRIKASVHKMRWFRRAALLAVIASVLSLWNAHQANHAAHKANLAVSAVIAQRKESRRIACNDANDAADKINALGTSMKGIVLLATAPNPNRTAVQQQAVDSFLKNSAALLNKAVVPKRDCSDRSIAKYFGEKEES
jgi:hypothetical protein